MTKFNYKVNNKTRLTLASTRNPHSDHILDLLESLTGPLHTASSNTEEVTSRDTKAVFNGLTQLSTIYGPVNLNPSQVTEFVSKFTKYIKILKRNMSSLDRFILNFNNVNLQKLQNSKRNTQNNTLREMDKMLRMLDPLIIFNKRITVKNSLSDDFVGPVFSGITRLSLLLSTPINIDMDDIQKFTQQYIFYRLGEQPNTTKHKQPNTSINNQTQTTKHNQTQPNTNKHNQTQPNTSINNKN
jgi:hypothetical protein